jgi:hypothetical protein
MAIWLRIGDRLLEDFHSSIIYQKNIFNKEGTSGKIHWLDGKQLTCSGSNGHLLVATLTLYQPGPGEEQIMPTIWGGCSNQFFNHLASKAANKFEKWKFSK